MKIYYHYEKYFTIYDTKTEQQEEVFDSLANIITAINPGDCMLLPEDQFIYTHRSYSFYSPTPLTISDFKTLINNQIIIDKKNNTLIEQMIEYQLINITINEQQENFYLGKTGQIRFDLLCIYTSAQSDIPLGALIEKKIIVQPAFLNTYLQINQHFQGTSYSILYCFHQTSRLLIVKKGVYSHCVTINFGTKDLKLMYQEQQIPKIYWNPSRVNPVIENIVKETSSFFAQQLVEWIKTIIPFASPCVIIGDVTKNHFVMDAIKQSYSTEIGGYMLPYGSLSGYNSNTLIPIDIVNYSKENSKT